MDFTLNDFRYFFLFGIIFWVLTVIIHIAFAFGVFSDATEGRKPVVLVPPAIWGLATLIGGVFVAAIYWAIHHSALSTVKEVDEPHKMPSVLDEV
jgi:hypothetical protein